MSSDARGAALTALNTGEAAYRAVIALPGTLGPEVCALVESQYELAAALSSALARADEAEAVSAALARWQDRVRNSSCCEVARREALEEAATIVKAMYSEMGDTPDTIADRILLVACPDPPTDESGGVLRQVLD